MNAFSLLRLKKFDSSSSFMFYGFTAKFRYVMCFHFFFRRKQMACQEKKRVKWMIEKCVQRKIKQSLRRVETVDKIRAFCCCVLILQAFKIY